MTKTAIRSRNAERTKSEILKAAQLVFAKTGYERTSTRAIAEEAGADVALIYRYFGSKKELYLAALEASITTVDLESWTKETMPEGLTEQVASSPDATKEYSQNFRFIFQALTSEDARPLVNQKIEELYFAPIEAWLNDQNIKANPRVLAAVYAGLFFEKLLRGGEVQDDEMSTYVQDVQQLFRSMLQG